MREGGRRGGREGGREGVGREGGQERQGGREGGREGESQLPPPRCTCWVSLPVTRLGSVLPTSGRAMYCAQPSPVLTWCQACIGTRQARTPRDLPSNYWAVDPQRKGKSELPPGALARFGRALPRSEHAVPRPQIFGAFRSRIGHCLDPMSGDSWRVEEGKRERGGVRAVKRGRNERSGNTGTTWNMENKARLKLPVEGWCISGQKTVNLHLDLYRSCHVPSPHHSPIFPRMSRRYKGVGPSALPVGRTRTLSPPHYRRLHRPSSRTRSRARKARARAGARFLAGARTRWARSTGMGGGGIWRNQSSFCRRR